jgi:hypothetical protein
MFILREQKHQLKTEEYTRKQKLYLYSKLLHIVLYIHISGYLNVVIKLYEGQEWQMK